MNDIWYIPLTQEKPNLINNTVGRLLIRLGTIIGNNIHFETGVRILQRGCYLARIVYKELGKENK